MSHHHQNLTRRIFQIEWVEKWEKLITMQDKLHSCNDDEGSTISRKLGVISGECKT